MLGRRRGEEEEGGREGGKWWGVVGEYISQDPGPSSAAAGTLFIRFQKTANLHVYTSKCAHRASRRHRGTQEW